MGSGQSKNQSSPSTNIGASRLAPVNDRAVLSSESNNSEWVDVGSSFYAEQSLEYPATEQFHTNTSFTTLPVNSTPIQPEQVINAYSDIPFALSPVYTLHARHTIPHPISNQPLDLNNFNYDFRLERNILRS